MLAASGLLPLPWLVAVAPASVQYWLHGICGKHCTRLGCNATWVYGLVLAACRACIQLESFDSLVGVGARCGTSDLQATAG